LVGLVGSRLVDGEKVWHAFRQIVLSFGKLRMIIHPASRIT